MYGQYESDCRGAWTDETQSICSRCGENCEAVFEEYDLDDGQPDALVRASDYPRHGYKDTLLSNSN